MADAYIKETYNRAGHQIGWRVRWRVGNKRPSKSFGLKEKAVAERFLAEVRTVQKSKPARLQIGRLHNTGCCQLEAPGGVGVPIRGSRRTSGGFYPLPGWCLPGCQPRPVRWSVANASGVASRVVARVSFQRLR